MSEAPETERKLMLTAMYGDGSYQIQVARCRHCAAFVAMCDLGVHLRWHAGGHYDGTWPDRIVADLSPEQLDHMLRFASKSVHTTPLEES